VDVRVRSFDFFKEVFVVPANEGTGRRFVDAYRLSFYRLFDFTGRVVQWSTSQLYDVVFELDGSQDVFGNRMRFDRLSLAARRKKATFRAVLPDILERLPKFSLEGSGFALVLHVGSP
jgi:hypothetical protein